MLLETKTYFDINPEYALESPCLAGRQAAISALITKF
jgi:hypothetical protein